MATKTTTLLIDDLDGGTAEETISFALDGVEYEIDLHGHHAQELREAMDKWMNAARRVGGRRGPTRRPAVVTSGNGSGSGSSNGRPDLNAVRTWARGNGYSVSDRGRIARSVMDEWIAAGRPGQ
jgi:hypothetical protein